jgi:hypothetical protein
MERDCEEGNTQESARGGAGRLGVLVRSAAKKHANKKNGRKGGLVKSRKKRIAARRNARRPRPGRRRKEG